MTEYSDNAGTEQQKYTTKVVICISFVGIFYIRDWCLRVCNVQRMVVALRFSKHDCYFGIQNTLHSIMCYVPSPLCGSTEEYIHKKTCYINHFAGLTHFLNNSRIWFTGQYHLFKVNCINSCYVVFKKCLYFYFDANRNVVDTIWPVSHTYDKWNV